MRTIQRFGWKRDLPDHRDLELRSLRESRTTGKKRLLPRKVSLADGFSRVPMYDQGQLGSCTANAIAAAVMFLEFKEVGDLSLTYPSRLFIYYGEREIEGSIPWDDGAEIRDGMKVVAKQGYPQEDSFPYDIRRFAERPSDGVYTEAKKDHITKYYRVPQTLFSLRICLAHGYPIVFGFTVYSNFPYGGNGDISMPSGGVDGGHAVVLTGYDDKEKMFDWRNSWGPGWGRNGYGRIPYVYVTDPNLCDDFWTIRRERIK